MLLLLFSFVLFVAPRDLSGQQGYLEVSAPGNRLLQMAIAPPAALSGAADAEVSRTIIDVFRFDMSFAGPFAVSEPKVAESRSGIRIGEFDMPSWRNAGTDLLIKSGYVVSGDAVSIEFRLYDVLTEKELAAKRYTGSKRDLRRVVHTFSDDVMSAMTGIRGPFTSKLAFVSTATGNKEIYLMDYDGQNVQRITKNGSINLYPDFSPNGRELIYTSYKKGNPDLYRRELSSGAEAKVTTARGTNITGAFAPDGNRIALSMSKDGNAEIYILSKEGKQLARLTTNDAIDIAPAWSPDGQQIAFVSDRLGKPQIFIMGADGKNVRRLTTSGAYNVSPRWSPRGDRITYCRQMNGGFQIFSINPDGSGDTQLTREGSNEHARWSSDGRYLAFSSKRGGREAIYIMRSDGTGQTKVSRGGNADSHPVWSPRW
ncbi:Tol-Pal system beta propeller repeat protein TolB [Geobacter pelophilus]|uniref:Tol-Pal system beta propeller repeat protein TolB n=1 Tax=Geoanaerobacter pelophilus TaxID=60036 RepID=A0AAW4L5D2_9BACT|nr:Tol-Pal system beta propeller repeat protein TolB [Geoanaerobacter pelophilus]MBT0665025.1 Tol-Pal system beta propeller repeat protein TolB [Geoanaerobacter pelophilus]